MKILKTINDLFKKSKLEWLDEARTAAEQLSDGWRVITIEDVLERCPLPKYLHRNTIGKVFSQKHFNRIGYTPSRRSVSHGRVIAQWVSKGTTLPDGWEEMKQQASEGDFSRVSVVD